MIANVTFYIFVDNYMTLSRAFYDRKRREGKHHSQALIALARRRVTVLWAMPHTRQAFDPMRKVA
jgi:hypothetical protein